MTKLTLLVCLSLAAAARADETTYTFAAESPDRSESISELARMVIGDYKDGGDREEYLNNLFRLQITAKEYADAIRSIQSLRDVRKQTDPAGAAILYLQYEIFAKAKLRQAAEDIPFERAFNEDFAATFDELDDRSAFQAAGSLSYNLEPARRRFESTVGAHKGSAHIGLTEAIALVRAFQPFLVYEAILPLTEVALAEDERRRYEIQDDVLITTVDGATLSAVVARPRRFSSPQPAALLFNIYSETAVDIAVAKQAAAYGYVGVVADARGKRLSPDEIVPYEHEVADTYDVIEWISQQPWSNGEVGMFGGSYSGFAQWAATKRLHPALKTIVPIAAAIPGLGLPMHNNVFISANYCWAFYVTNNKFLDNEVCRDSERWDTMIDEWYASGRPYREIDRVDGTPNKFLQRWLSHPAYDEYWQGMVPFRADYSRIDIPILSITGYYDDGQISALHYLKEHYEHNPTADHHLIIGPYDHAGVQGRPSPRLREYSIDPVAQINPVEISFQWLDHVLRGEEKPELVKDRVNFQVMGTNEWRHVSTMEEASLSAATYYLSNAKAGDYYRLAETKPADTASLPQVIDFTDRTTTSNDYYPDPVIRENLDLESGLEFVSEPFAQPVEINGAFSGELKATINKQDLDVSIVLYERTPDGRYFHLSYFLGRASYAKDMTSRRLLKPGVVESIPIERTYMTSRRLEPGSRLVVVLNVHKQPGAQINYGTGRDVSDETIADAKEPLRVEWHNDSYLVIPMSR